MLVCRGIKGLQRSNAQQCRQLPLPSLYQDHQLPRSIADAVLVIDLQPPHLRWRLNRRRQASLLRMRKRAWSHSLNVLFVHVGVNGHAVVWRQSCPLSYTRSGDHARTHTRKGQDKGCDCWVTWTQDRENALKCCRQQAVGCRRDHTCQEKHVTNAMFQVP